MGAAVSEHSPFPTHIEIVDRVDKLSESFEKLHAPLFDKVCLDSMRRGRSSRLFTFVASQ
jgi:hypothetical protein